MKDEKQKKKRPDYTFGLTLLGILVVILIILLLCKSCGNDDNLTQLPDNDTPPTTNGIVYDDNIEEGGWEEADVDTIVSGLNDKVEEGMINISMNTSPYLKTGNDSANLMIVNEKINRYPQVVEIRRNDNDELIYKSGAIPVGSKIETAKLSTVLSKGVYECTAMFYNVDPDTGNYLGCAGAVINITVLE